MKIDRCCVVSDFWGYRFKNSGRISGLGLDSGRSGWICNYFEILGFLSSYPFFRFNFICLKNI